MQLRISVNPQIHFGKPCVTGTRIPVQAVLELVREGIGFHEIVEDYYPDLGPDDIRACVQYAVNREVGPYNAAPLMLHAALSRAVPFFVFSTDHVPNNLGQTK